MKHLFVVHSNITYLAALGVICKENLPLEDVKIYSPHFFVNEPIAVTKIDIPSFKDAITKLQFGKWFNLSRSVDNQINEFLSEDDFIAYVPSIPFPVNIFVTHKRCVGFHFIEEGLSNYDTDWNLNKLFKIIPSQSQWRFNFMQRLNSAQFVFRSGGLPIHQIGYTDQCYTSINTVKYYGFFEDTFVFAPKQAKIMISLEHICNQFFQNYDVPNLSDSDVLLLGTSISDPTLKKDYISTLNELLQNIDPGKRIFLKFHPIEDEQDKRDILKLIKQYNLDCVILDRSVMIEILLIKHKNLTIIGCGSSLNLYASLLGSTSISYGKKLYPHGLIYQQPFWNKYVTEL